MKLLIQLVREILYLSGKSQGISETSSYGNLACLRLTEAIYRKIPKISPGAYIFQRPFLRGLYSEGLIYGGKFAFQNRLG